MGGWYWDPVRGRAFHGLHEILDEIADEWKMTTATDGIEFLFKLKEDVMPPKTIHDYSFGYLVPIKGNNYTVKKIIHSGPCTIVFWEDDTKTIVRLEEGKEYDEYAAFTAALAKKVYGTNSKVHKILKTKTAEEKTKETK